jgi:hypothetical protein
MRFALIKVLLASGAGGILVGCAADADTPTAGQDVTGMQGDAAIDMSVSAPNDASTRGADAADAGWDTATPDSGPGADSEIADAGDASEMDASDASDADAPNEDASKDDASDSAPPNTGPCDIYAAAGTPCVAAHSTVRSLYGSFAGSLYQVRRASDQATKDIGVLAAGGVADAATQDAFCRGTTCTISIVYDQSPRRNHLKSAPGGGAAKNPDVEADAAAFPLTIAGHRAYAIYVNPGIGYRNDTTRGIATGDEPEGEYMVTSGKHYNGRCCFDYGNAETNNLDTGAGHMEAVYFGGPGPDAGGGPWVLADLENGLFTDQNAGARHAAVPYDYVTAMVKGEPNHWAIEVGNAQAGALLTKFDGVRPHGYDPMHKEGAIILGIGGDNSNRAAGVFFEGCMTSGFPTNAADSAVQANIVAAGYGH